MSGKFLCLAVFLVAAQSFAADPAGGPAVGKVGMIQVYNDGMVIFALEGAPGALPPICGDASVINGKQYAKFMAGANFVTVEGARAWLSLLTAAKLSGKNIKIVTQNTTVADLCVVSTITLP
jgi:hypothetical protein